MFFHSGGFMLGDFPTPERLVRDLVSDSGFISIFVNYTRSPEAKYPTAINEAYAVTKWVTAHGDEIGVDGKRLAVVGNSAGGTMAAVTALKCKLEGGPPLKAQILFWPATDADLERSSYNEYANGYLLTKSMVKWFWDNNVPDLAQRRENDSIRSAPCADSAIWIQDFGPVATRCASRWERRSSLSPHAPLVQSGVPTPTTPCPLWPAPRHPARHRSSYARRKRTQS
jgi:acetyl esterase